MPETTSSPTNPARTASRPAGRLPRRLTDALAERLGDARFDMWFGGSRLDVDGDLVTVEAESAFAAKWMENHLAGALREVVHEALGAGARIEIRVPRPAADAPVPAAPEPTEPRRDAAGPRPAAPRFRCLDDFIVGACNRLAFSAACRLAEDAEARVISPLFIHGECGVGKTHLLQGICRRFGDAIGRRSAVRYVTGEQFTNEYIAAVRAGTLERFRGRMRRLEMLAIDDVHFLSNKQKTQNEFLHTLDAIDLTGARVVLASDEHPRQIRTFSQALVSRFLSGMVVQVERPDRRTREALIRRLADARGLQLSPAATQRLSMRCVGSVREIEGAVTRLSAVRMLAGDETATDAEIGAGAVEQIFRDRAWRPSAPIRIDRVIDAVCRHLGIGAADLMGNGRHRRVVAARGLVAYLGRELTTHSFPEIARAIGRRYHSTVYTAARRLQEQVERDETLVLAGGEAPIAVRELVDTLRHDILRGEGGPAPMRTAAGA